MILIKTPDQIEGIRKSCQLAAKTLKYLKDFIEPGITTNHINKLADSFIRDHNAVPAPLNYGAAPGRPGFPASICTSVNEVVCHGVPDNTPLKEGDILNVDVTTILDGYYGDTSTMFEIGEVSDKAKDLLETTKTCLWEGIKVVKPSLRINTIGEAISIHAKKRGYTIVTDFCGHGVGLEFHEEPRILHCKSITPGPLFVPGMTFTIEPMLNEGYSDCVICEDMWTAKTSDGKLSAQYEHTILVTKNGYEVLTLLESDSHESDAM